ncbi:folylpolyglutamate synthase / dihydrofolate synthase [Buchnera aphidicola str. APS (Acyrthosiphon pisum)]|uniref:Dihydrofolate synthase/folylpolyglutamate synthase n=1 Tax=Buchnera aphidicola subsp. Acyrthosiphon pisum (strain APS) TaxID=107806 RepID=FOLC_BUCAI|nr:bifunctional tetrahydrofolate synthase/dihydrofolate synthase [Buchnera aphidicola]P57265.1 RecName: Full=Dihydrofolate synthase/folylpolyglutamate synthase; Short=DHFS / FPGS; AltName: Full=Folylpoly-gamma-glutamate synthetase-dihydrofolate synthetase; AltName: Full=Folylpolyglutamate synthetase; AltName: Full=Tetrahydrofolylpolyglutamate synthase [Buchnera aphidicola str. APS (Acyrthosiphon pisum)]pir/E84949/ tetrahydrofolylpolyglutamate synthase (EC 6.3.2.17) [imported] - Buchnera sp. (stra
MINKNYSLSLWLKYLEQLDKKRIYNLTELKFLAKKLGLLKSESFIFTVAGTNGKGTTCAVLERLLLDSGYQVGLYTSPHLINFVERVRINGFVLHEEEHIDSFQNVELVRNGVLLTYFEFITLAALILFKRYSLDCIILKVGLGGRLDATNIIDSDISIITNIGIDHTSILGRDRISIAREKCGVFRKNKISVIGETDIPCSMYQIAKEKKTILKKIDIDWSWEKKRNYWNFFHSTIQLYNLPETQVPLSSAATALSTLYYSRFKIKEKIIRKSISNVQLPGRFQVISTFPYIIVDVAHNPNAAFYLSQKIDEINITGKIYAVVGILKDKDILGIIDPLANKIHHWFTAPLKTIRTATKHELKKFFPIHNTSILKSIEIAYKKALILVKKEDAIIIFGSFLTVSEFLSLKI